MLVQFGNSWIQKIPRTAKLDSAYGLVQFWQSSELFLIQLFPNWTACSPISYTNNMPTLLRLRLSQEKYSWYEESPTSFCSFMLK